MQSRIQTRYLGGVVSNLSRPSKRLIMMGTDVFWASLCLTAGYFLRLDNLNFVYSFDFVIALALTITFSILGLHLMGAYKQVLRFLTLEDVLTLGSAAVIPSVALFLFAQTSNYFIPRSIAGIYATLFFVIITFERLLLRELINRHTELERSNVVIYGAGQTGRQLLSSLLQTYNYKPVFLIDDNPELQKTTIGGLKIYSLDQAVDIIPDRKINTVLISIPNFSLENKKRAVSALQHTGVSIKTIASLKSIIEDKASFETNQLPPLRNVKIEELLGREPVTPNLDLIKTEILNQVILVTGAGGTIGGEICRQLIALRPSYLLLMDNSEFALYQIQEELKTANQANGNHTKLLPFLVSVQNRGAVEFVLKKFGVQQIFHAAAYKHVPLVEQNIIEAVMNNVIGTKVLAEASILHNVRKFVTVSTDKAVRPTNFMGATKRVAELICKQIPDDNSHTIFSSVRFGNVLGSSGSVVPKFEKQIAAGGPITVTDVNVTRYFMTKAEAAQLVLQAAAMSTGNEVFILDMGRPTKIIDLAKRMARLSDHQPYVVGTEAEPNANIKSIAIEITGLRHGEKLFEELLVGEHHTPSLHPRIFTEKETSKTASTISSNKFRVHLTKLENAAKERDIERTVEELKVLVEDFKPYEELADNCAITLKAPPE